MEMALLEEDVDFNWTDQIVLSLRGKKITELVLRPRLPRGQTASPTAKSPGCVYVYVGPSSFSPIHRVVFFYGDLHFE
jgi:hypothetical protein